MANPSNPRAQILALLNGERGISTPPWGVLSMLTAPALTARNLNFSEVHQDAEKMALAAASAHDLHGFQSATVPTSLIVEAEALGANVDFRDDETEPMWPLIYEPLFHTPADVTIPAGDFAQRGRIPLIAESIRILKQRLGDQIVIGAWIAGPFTLANYVVSFETLLPSVKTAPQDLARALDKLTDILPTVATAYTNAGADFITIHEMGGSPGVIGPRVFGELVLPRLQSLTRVLTVPTILSVCGNTNNAMELLAQSGATALHVEHTNNLAHSREILGDQMLLLGNLDPVGLLAHGTPDDIRAAVAQAHAAGADAVMPGCDLYLDTPKENILALAEALGKN